MLCAALSEDSSAKEWVVSVVIGTDAFLKRLNREYKGKDVATDVLSFLTEDPANLNARCVDVAVSADRAIESAPQYGNSADRELALYILHGVLHAMGYEDSSPALKEKMFKRQDELMRRYWDERK